MRLEGLEIAVVGAGIGGLAAATALAQRRARVRVFEQAPALGEVGAGIQVAPNGVAVLEALGMRDAAEARASLPEAVELVDFRRGRPVGRVPLGQAIVARHGRPYWHLHRADLLAVLAAGADEAGVALSLGAPVAGVEPDGEGLRVRTADGGGGRFDVVVAADGVRSPLRAARLDPAPARFTRHVAWRALVPADRAPAEFLRPAARVTMGPGRHLVSYPLRGRSLVNLVAIEEREDWAEEGWSTPDDPANLRARLRRLGRSGGGAHRRGRGLLALGALRPRAAARAGSTDGWRCSATPATRCCRSWRRARRWRSRTPGCSPTASTSPRTRGPDSSPTRRRGWPAQRGCSARRRGPGGSIIWVRAFGRRSRRRSAPLPHWRPGCSPRGSTGSSATT